MPLSRIKKKSAFPLTQVCFCHGPENLTENQSLQSWAWVSGELPGQVGTLRKGLMDYYAVIMDAGDSTSLPRQSNFFEFSKVEWICHILSYCCRRQHSIIIFYILPGFPLIGCVYAWMGIGVPYSRAHRKKKIPWEMARLSIFASPLLCIRGALMFPDSQCLARLAMLQITKYPSLPEPSGCRQPRQGTCPQGVLSQAEAPPACHDCSLQMSPSLFPDEPAGKSEHCRPGLCELQNS